MTHAVMSSLTPSFLTTRRSRREIIADCSSRAAAAAPFLIYVYRPTDREILRNAAAAAAAAMRFSLPSTNLLMRVRQPGSMLSRPPGPTQLAHRWCLDLYRMNVTSQQVQAVDQSVDDVRERGARVAAAPVPRKGARSRGSHSWRSPRRASNRMPPRRSRVTSFTPQTERTGVTTSRVNETVRCRSSSSVSVRSTTRALTATHVGGPR
jgi:hypothetical protein